MDKFVLPMECTSQYGYHLIRLPDVRVLDELEAAALRTHVEEFAQGQEGPRVAVSLKDVKLVSTAAWGKILVIHRQLTREEGRFVLIEVGDDLMEVLKMMKIAALLDIRANAESLAEA